MKISALKAAFIVVAMGFLAACQAPLVDKTGPLSITSVTVSTDPAVRSATPIGPAIQAAASATLVRETPDGTPADVHITVENVTYKNAVMSLLVGSANSLHTKVVVTGKDHAVLGETKYFVVLDAAINGVIGAAIAASQDPANVDREMTDKYASGLAERIYGRPGHKPKAAAKAQTTPVAKAATPAEPPVPTSKPGKPVS